MITEFYAGKWWNNYLGRRTSILLINIHKEKERQHFSEAHITESGYEKRQISFFTDTAKFMCFGDFTTV